MGQKPIYELVTESGRAINTTAEHPYLVRDNSIGFVMVPESVKDKNIVFDFEHEDETSNMNSFVFAEVFPEIFEMINESEITVDELCYLFFNGNSKDFVFTSQFIKDFFQSRSNDELKTHFKPIKESNSVKVIGLISPDLSFLEVCSIDSITSLTTDSFTSLKSFSGISDISLITDNFKFITSCLTILSNAKLNSCLNSAGMSTLTTIFSINEDNDDNYLKLSEWTKQIRDFHEPFILKKNWLKVSELEEGMEIAVPDYETGKIK